MRFSLVMRFFRAQHWTYHILFTTFLAYPHMDFLMALILPIIFCQQAFLFASNDYFDREIDAKDPAKKNRNVISSGELPLRQARIILMLVVGVSLVLSYLISMLAFVVNAVWLLVAALYTAPPIRFKKRVGLDLLIHGLTVFAFPFLFTMTVTLGFTVRNTILGVLFVCISVFSQILQETRDFETDSLVERNSVIAMGLRTSLLVMTGLLLTALVLSSFLVITDRISIFFALISAISFCWIYDIARTWKSGRLTEASFNCFNHFLRKTCVCLIPIVLVWALG